MRICCYVGEVDPDAVAEHFESGVDRRLGADQTHHVRLGDRDVVVGATLVCPADDVFGHAVQDPHPRAWGVAVDVARLVDHSGHEQLGKKVEETTAADADGRGVVDRPKRGFQSRVVDEDVLDRARRGAHPVPHAAALEGRAGRAGAREQPVPGAEHHLAVGADVDEQRELVGREHPRGDDAGGDVAADVAAHRGQHVDAGQLVRVQAELSGDQLGGRRDRRDIRLLAQETRVEAEQQMRHRRVAGDRHLVDLVELDPVALLQLVEQVVDGLDGEISQVLEPALALRVDDARDDVVAAGDLPVVGAGRVDDAPGREIDEVGDHRRRAQVDGHPHARHRKDRRVDTDEARRQVGAVHPVAHLEGDADPPVGRPQVLAQAAQHRQLRPDLVDAVLLEERSPQAVEVARVVGERGRLDVEDEGADCGVLAPVAGERQRLRLGDGVAVRPHRRLAPLGHLDLDGASDEGLAGDRPAVEDLRGDQAGVAATLNLTRRDAHAATAAAALSPARGGDVELAEDGRVQEAGASRHVDGLARGRESDRAQRSAALAGRRVVHRALTRPIRSSDRKGCRRRRADRP